MQVLAFYKFTPIADTESLRESLQSFGDQFALRGTILVADEGVNGTVMGLREVLRDLCELLEARCGDIPFKWSRVNEGNQGFYRYKVRVKPEIVSFGQPALEVASTGTHVDAHTWNSLLDDPDTIVIDTRNQYEIDIGTFPGAVSPQTDSFREFPAWVAEQLDTQKNKKVAMFCTGGIRCEKASAYLNAQGFESVYQLDGGILKYLETVDAQANRWDGECFVFDQRVSVNAQLQQGEYKQCYACRHPLSVDELASEDYVLGVSCPHCVATLDPERKKNFAQRQHQVELAKARGESHIGVPTKQRR